jgi:hypothetical protein
VRSAAQENDHEDEKHDPQARPGQPPATFQNSGFARSRE